MIGAVALNKILMNLVSKGIVLSPEQIHDLERGRLSVDHEGRLQKVETAWLK